MGLYKENRKTTRIKQFTSLIPCRSAKTDLGIAIKDPYSKVDYYLK